MIPTLVLVGRPNVGKSTLFNRFTKTRDALVADQPGLTRDRHYGVGRLGSRDYLVVDTAGFDPVAKDGIMHEMARQAEQAIDKVWADYKKNRGRKALDAYVLGVAQDCSDLYMELAEQEAAETEGQVNALGTLSAAALRSYTTRTGNSAEVANYLVYHYPYGKDLFKPNEDGDLLGQLIVEAGPNGLRLWSDEAIYAIANKHYWQYNPPATRLVFAEYQRRMRMMRQTEAEAKRWAKRAADDRAAQARRSSAGYVGSLGTGKPYKPKPGSGVYVCTTHKGTGGGRVCKEE